MYGMYCDWVWCAFTWDATFLLLWTRPLIIDIINDKPNLKCVPRPTIRQKYILYPFPLDKINSGYIVLYFNIFILEFILPVKEHAGYVSLQ